MGKVIRAKDWSQTPLGPIELWPQSLRTTVSLCLSSNFPIAIAWGPQHVQIYNDGYWPICASKHPHSMGEDFSECWASAFPVIGDAFRSALSGTTAFLEDQRMFLDRLGYLEETFFTFSFSPIRDETGEVAGLFHPVTETTSKMLTQRRTRALRDVVERAGHARSMDEGMALVEQALAEFDLDLPFVLFYRLDADGRSARLAGETGLVPGTAANPATVSLAQASAGWPLAEVAEAGKPRYVDDVQRRFPGLRCGPYPEPIQSAFVLPIIPPGSARPACLLVAGASVRLPMNEAYRTFFDLLADAVTSVVANAVAYEAERQRAEALAAIDRAKTAFFSNVSHEFRTPLTLILGPIEDELSETDQVLPPPRRARLQAAHRNSLRLLRLVNALLDFSRIEAGRVNARYTPCDLAGLTTDLASNFRAACERAGLRLIVDCPPVREPVYIDVDMWEKIVLNLLSNAFKFTLHGEIAVRLRTEGNTAVLTVSDTGVGVPADELPHVFERFYRTRVAEGRTQEGSGIGLALVRELVALHGGDIRIDSVHGRGTTLTLSIPLGHAHLPQEQVGGKHKLPLTSLGAAPYVEEAMRWLPEQPAGEEPGLNDRDGGADAVSAEPSTAQATQARPRIVWADDNADMRAYVRRLLADRYEVEAVANGEEALAAARRRAPDLVLSDVMMPRLDGFGLLRELRADARTNTVPFVLLSARAGEEARTEGLDAGADDYLVKPFSARELLAVVGSQINMARLRREAGELRLAAERAALQVMREIADAMPQIVWKATPDGRIDYFNRRWLAYSGMSFDETKDFGWLSVVHPEEREGCRARWNASVASGDDFTLEVHLRRAVDGAYRWHLGRGVASRDGNDVVVGWFGTFTDIDDRKQAEAELEQRVHERTAQLESSNKELEAFSYSVSHDLRAPLRHIAGYAELLEKKSALLDDKGRHYLTAISDEAVRMGQLIDDVLAFSRAGRAQLHKMPTDLRALVMRVLGGMHPELARRQIDWILPEPVTVQADPQLLHQVVANLLSNAVKFTAKRERAQIEVGWRREPGRVVVWVRDNGAGFDMRYVDKLFGVFQRLHAMHEFPGTGIGLANVQRIVRRHGGDAWGEGRHEQGATFYFSLPD